MRAVLFESISLNGKIARSDGRGDFFTEFCWSGFVEIAQRTGAMVWGRTTHDRMRGLDAALDDLAGVRGVVLTSDAGYDPGAGWTTAQSPAAALEQLAQQGAEEMLVVGGQTVNTAFAAAGLIDEIVVFVESVAIGRGLGLFAEVDMPDLRLRLLEVDRATEAVLQLRYEVV